MTTAARRIRNLRSVLNTIATGPGPDHPSKPIARAALIADADDAPDLGVPAVYAWSDEAGRFLDQVGVCARDTGKVVRLFRVPRGLGTWVSEKVAGRLRDVLADLDLVEDHTCRPFLVQGPASALAQIRHVEPATRAAGDPHPIDIPSVDPFPPDDDPSWVERTVGVALTSAAKLGRPVWIKRTEAYGRGLDRGYRGTLVESRPSPMSGAFQSITLRQADHGRGHVTLQLPLDAPVWVTRLPADDGPVNLRDIRATS